MQHYCGEKILGHTDVAWQATQLRMSHDTTPSVAYINTLCCGLGHTMAFFKERTCAWSLDQLRKLILLGFLTETYDPVDFGYKKVSRSKYFHSSIVLEAKYKACIYKWRQTCIAYMSSNFNLNRANVSRVAIVSFCE